MVRYSGNDYDQVIERIWMGGWINEATDLSKFDVVTSHSRSWAVMGPYTNNLEIKGKLIVEPFNDSLDMKEVQEAWNVATRVSRGLADDYGSGSTILITCQAGLNRSGLVVGMLMSRVLDWNSDQIIEAIREARGSAALINPAFEALVRVFHANRFQY